MWLVEMEIVSAIISLLVIPLLGMVFWAWLMSRDDVEKSISKLISKIYVVNASIIDGLISRKIKLEGFPDNSKFFTAYDQSDNIKKIEDENVRKRIEPIDVKNDAIIKFALRIAGRC
ncbi:MAG: hypothetical protein R1F54_05330 [Candidatus Zeuxoniibacter abyssi]|nr:MAG: hypothetical protein R1F54_05330 [Candidatus Persebacteraceae bacterium AB1(2)]